MTADTHPVEREQLMAYLDGELSPESAAIVAAHLKDCVDCRQLEADLRAVSSQMLAWNVEPASSQLNENVLAALHATPIVESIEEAKNRAAEAAYKRRMRRGKWLVALATAALMLFVVGRMFNRGASETSGLAGHPKFQTYIPSLSPAPASPSPALAPRATPPTVSTPPPASAAPAQALPAIRSSDEFKALQTERQQRAEESRRSNDAKVSNNLAAQAQQNWSVGALTGGLLKEKKETNGDLVSAPQIARTASLKISVKNFQSAREGVDRIVQSFHGYAATMTINTAVGEPQSLSAELHIPSTQTDAALAALKALGRVEQEQQGGEEVTAQVVDLDARLKNARETETRMQDILKTRTGKVTDVLEVENQIAAVRGSIEQMEGEQKALRTRISFSTITLDLHEEYQASLETNEPSAGRRIRNAFIDGFRSAAEGSLSLLEFLLNAGPTLILIAIFCFWPARWAWRRFANRPRNETALAH